MDKKSLHFFPGGNTSDGFFSYYNYITPKDSLEKIYTIKGGPGVGKSTFMKDIAHFFEKQGETVEYYHCSSDPNSLDGILLKERKILFTDGTAPHIIDPVYPGVLYEMINLADFFDSQKLSANKKDIIKLTDEISDIFKYSYGYLKSVKNIKNSLEAQYEKAVKKNDLNTFSKILAKKIIKNKQGKEYSEQKLFISAITPYGLRSFVDINSNFENIFVLNTNSGDISYRIIEKIKEALKINEFKIQSFYCPTSPATHTEHIFVPELSCALITSNNYHRCFKGETIDTKELYDYSKLSRDDINYDSSLYDNLINRSINILKRAKEAHDKLEDYYIRAMDYTKLNNFKKNFISSILV